MFLGRSPCSPYDRERPRDSVSTLGSMTAPPARAGRPAPPLGGTQVDRLHAQLILTVSTVIVEKNKNKIKIRLQVWFAAGASSANRVSASRTVPVPGPGPPVTGPWLWQPPELFGASCRVRVFSFLFCVVCRKKRKKCSQIIKKGWKKKPTTTTPLEPSVEVWLVECLDLRLDVSDERSEGMKNLHVVRMWRRTLKFLSGSSNNNHNKNNSERDAAWGGTVRVAVCQSVCSWRVRAAGRDLPLSSLRARKSQILCAARTVWRCGHLSSSSSSPSTLPPPPPPPPRGFVYPQLAPIRDARGHVTSPLFGPITTRRPGGTLP